MIRCMHQIEIAFKTLKGIVSKSLFKPNTQKQSEAKLYPHTEHYLYTCPVAPSAVFPLS